MSEPKSVTSRNSIPIDLYALKGGLLLAKTRDEKDGLPPFTGMLERSIETNQHNCAKNSGVMAVKYYKNPNTLNEVKTIEKKTNSKTFQLKIPGYLHVCVKDSHHKSMKYRELLVKKLVGAATTHKTESTMNIWKEFVFGDIDKTVDEDKLPYMADLFTATDCMDLLTENIYANCDVEEILSSTEILDTFFGPKWTKPVLKYWARKNVLPHGLKKSDILSCEESQCVSSSEELQRLAATDLHAFVEDSDDEANDAEMDDPLPQT